MDDTAVIFMKHLSLHAADIDVDCLISYLQKLLPDVKFEGMESDYEKIKALVTGLGQKHPKGFGFVLDYLAANAAQPVYDSICDEVTRKAINYEELLRNGLQNLSIDESDRKNQSSVNKDQHVNQTITVVAESRAEKNEMEPKQKSARKLSDAEVSNGGISKEPIGKKKSDPKSMESRIILIGGSTLKTIEIFHPTNPNVPHVTKIIGDMIPVLGQQCLHIGNNQVMIIGGRVFITHLQHRPGEMLKQTSIINLNTFAVTPGPNLPQSTSMAAAASLNGVHYVCGGLRIPEYFCTTACYKLVDNNQKWITASSLNNARLNHTMCALNGHLYVVGGQNDAGETVKSVERYDPLADKWINLESQMYGKGRASPASLVHRGKIWVTGGTAIGDKTTEVFDASTETWSFGPPLNYGRLGQSMAGLDGRMYVIGGVNRSKGETIEVFNDDKNEWELVDYKLDSWLFSTFCFC